MATKPTPGASDGTYGTEMNAFLDIGHDADGTHKKSQMLTDMGWSPTSYVGAESVTYPNGMIKKTGTVTSAATSGTVTFAVAFSTSVSLQLTIFDNAATTNDLVFITHTTTEFTWAKSASINGFYWEATGY